MGVTYSSENRWTFLRCWCGDPAPINAGHGRHEETLRAAGNKCSRTVDFGNPYTEPLSSSARKSVELMMIEYLVFFLFHYKSFTTYIIYHLVRLRSRAT
ncbi:jg10641 [Pararge aegeria aegeria]|uniref:Jg10641 protein n=1 Tax=Pararge aegeria aegeria TaxID=348720 RepID=A0A8S4RAS0_9NEOP|nr:jg10641 [Pararge aegeria aegeria]